MIGIEQKRKLPDGWKWVKLHDLLNSLETGSRPKGGATGILEGIPSISAEHMTSYGAFDFSNLRFVPEDFYKEMVRGHIKRDDILVVKDGATTGKVCFIDDNFPFEKAVVNEHVFLCRPNKSVVIPYYLFFWLWSLDGQTAIRVNFQGAAIGGINQKFVNSVIIPLPPLPEQKRIAGILTEQMAAAEKARRACEEKLTLARELSNSYLNKVFGDLENLNYRKSKLSEICTVVRGSSPRPKGDPVYYGGNVPRLMVEDLTRDGMYVTPKIDFLTEEGAKRSRPMSKGDLVIVVSGAPGLPGILAVDACIHDGFVGLRNLNRKIIKEVYLFYFLKYINFRTDSNATGAIFRNLTTTQIKAVDISIPPIEVQFEVIEKLNQPKNIIDQLCLDTIVELELINKLPASLLKQAFEGRL